MKNLSDKLMKEIKDQEIKPIPKTVFILRNSLLWLISLVSIIIGSLSVSLILYTVTNHDYDIYTQLRTSFIGSLISSLPYLWIALVIISLILTITNLEHTKKGYRYSPLLVTLASLAITVIIGFIGFQVGLGAQIDSALGKTFTNYQSVDAQKKAVWTQPDQGLFSGQIQSVTETTFILKDFTNQEWTVDYSHAVIRGRTQITVGSQIKLIGHRNGSQITATDIRPWGMGNGQHRNGQNQ